MVIEITITKGLGVAEPTSGTDTSDVNERKDNRPGVSADYAPNILDDYDSYAYHFRLFMMDEDSIKKRNIGPASKDRRIIIAESGSTTIGIDEVSITSYPAPGKKNGFGVSTEFQFTLMQPLGANLLDLIFAGANRLGVNNFSKVPVFLELSFRGRQPDRSLGGVIPGFAQSALLGEDSLSDVVWIWPLFLSDMQMDINAGGSSYLIRAGLYEQMAYTNQAADLEKKTTIAANTVLDFFTELEKQLTTKEADKTEKSKTQEIQDTYTFYIDKEISGSKIVPDLAEEVANRSAEFNVENTDKMEYSFDQGTSIDKIVETVLATTEYLQKKAKGTNSADAAVEEGNKEKAVIQTVYKLITDTQIGEFDKTRNDYARHYRYLIVPYEMTTNQTPSNAKANVGDQQRYDIVKNKGRLRKAYNYIYTGLNDQVFDFEIAFNFNWHAAVPFQAGVTTSSANSETTGKEAKVDPEGNPEEANKKKEGNKFGSSGPFGEFVDELGRFVESDATISGLAEGIATGDFDQLTGQASELIASQISKGVRVAGNKFAPRLVQSRLEERDAIVEDETPESLSALRSSVSYIESDPGIQHRISGGYAESAGKTLLTTMFEQAQSAIDADLMDITMRIKGDPHWLEPGPVGRNSEFKTTLDATLEKYGTTINHEDPTGSVLEIITGPNTEVTSMDATGNQEYMLFRSFTPKEFNEATGLTEAFDDNNVLNGVYAVRLIEHNFSGGQFTQTLDAIRDPNISLRDVDLGVGVADTRGLLEQFNIENIIDNVPSVFDDITLRQSGEDPSGTSGGVQNA